MTFAMGTNMEGVFFHPEDREVHHIDGEALHGKMGCVPIY